MSDLFEKFNKSMGPLGKWASIAEGYFVFPCLLYTSPSPRDAS